MVSKEDRNLIFEIGTMKLGVLTKAVFVKCRGWKPFEKFLRNEFNGSVEEASAGHPREAGLRKGWGNGAAAAALQAHGCAEVGDVTASLHYGKDRSEDRVGNVWKREEHLNKDFNK